MGDTDSRDERIEEQADELEMLLASRHGDEQPCDDLCRIGGRVCDDLHALMNRALRAEARATEAEKRAKQARGQALIEAADAIRAEWVCGCVAEHSDNDKQWHDCCKYSEWAARNVESRLAALGPSTAPGADG